MQHGRNFLQRFQSTLPRRERPKPVVPYFCVHIVSIHAPAKGATLFSLFVLFAVLAFQSTLPRRERLLAQFRCYGDCTVSIHAPAKGATDIETELCDVHPVSIHAPAKGATVDYFRRVLPATSFNPRSREGSDRGVYCQYRRYAGFQSTLPRRERRTAPPRTPMPHRFNPRSREGSDISMYLRPAWGKSFNPRSREGSDAIVSLYVLIFSVFQSTLPRRERQQFQPKIHSNFQQKSTNYHFIYLIFPLFPSPLFLHSTSFVHILECESPGIFMSASYSHSYIITKSMYHLLQFRDRHPYVPPLSDTYFPDNRISGCQRSHQ